MTRPPPADWQLPEGVERGLWEYMHSRELAVNYDDGLSQSLLFHTDLAFAEEHCDLSGRFLDLGCGTGRALLHFAKRGCSVVGLDYSPEMLKVIRGKAHAEGLDLPCLRASMVDLSALGDASFDNVLCLFSTLGMLAGREPRERACREMARVLKPGGTLILHVHNRWHNLRDPQGRRWLLRNMLASCVGKAEAGDCVMPQHHGGGHLKLHLFIRREVCRLLRRCGFRIEVLRPLSLEGDGYLRRPWLLGRLRAYGYLIAAKRAG